MAVPFLAARSLANGCNAYKPSASGNYYPKMPGALWICPRSIRRIFFAAFAGFFRPAKHQIQADFDAYLVSGFSTLFTAVLGYKSGQINLTDRVYNQLTSVRASKASQIEAYFRHIQNHTLTLTLTLSEDLSIVAAVQEFDAAYQQLGASALPPNSMQALEQYYRKEFLPRLDKFHSGIPILESYLVNTPASRYLQYHYIAANPNPVSRKQLLNAANDGTAYSRVHGLYHPIFRNIVSKFGYYDMFLINPQGQIVYTVLKRQISAVICRMVPTEIATWPD